MKYKFNIFTGTFDLVNDTGTGTGVTRQGSTQPKSIPRWVGTDQDIIDGSKARIQDSGAIQAQGHITNREVNGTVTVEATESWIAPSLEMQPGSTIVLGAGAQLIII